MTRLRIDFAPARSWAARPFMWIALALALGWCGYEAWRYRELVAAHQALQSDLSAAHSRIGEMAGRTAAKSQVSARDWNQAVRTAAQLNAPWGRLLEEVQLSVGDKVALLSMEADVATASLRLQAEAKDMDALVAFAGRLRAVAGFEDVALESHQVSLQDPLLPVRFSVALRVNPALIDAPIAFEAGWPR